MVPLSRAQYAASARGAMPETERIADGLWSISMPMPGRFLAYTLSVVHVAPGGDVTVVDPGFDLPGSLDRLHAEIAALGADPARVAHVVLTHGHPDHIGLAPTLRAKTGAQVLLHRAEQDSLRAATPDAQELTRRLEEWGVASDRAHAVTAQLPTREATPAPPEADVLLEDGDVLPITGFAARVLWTPGHTPGHVCLVDETRGVILTGDHVLPTVHPGIGLGAGRRENPVTDYLDSLERLAPFDDLDVVPGHGYLFRGLAQRRGATAAHVRRRASEVARTTAADPDASIYEVASQLTWTGGWAQVEQSLMLFSALSQTEQYQAHAGG